MLKQSPSKTVQKCKKYGKSSTGRGWAKVNKLSEEGNDRGWVVWVLEGEVFKKMGGGVWRGDGGVWREGYSMGE